MASLSDEVLLEIVDIVRRGLVEEKDISDLLREIDLIEDGFQGPLVLSPRYIAAHPRENADV